ncbi:hypothetical protein ACQRIU_003633 [Beauveria bassiana]
MDLNPADDVFLQDDRGLTIAQHALRCSQAFETCLAAPQTTYDPTIMEDQMARFTLWTSNMDVFGPPNVSLDYRLRYSPTVVDILHQLLDVILNTLIFLTPCEKSARTPTTKKRRTSESGRANVTKTVDHSSETDSEGDIGERNVYLTTYTIGGTVSQLCLLSNAVRRSMTELPRAKSVAVNSKLSLPAAPKTSECPYCGVILEFNGDVRSERWSNHLLRDLEPFVCVIGHCTDSGALKPGSLTFDTSRAWLSHMENSHGHVWECRAPSHQPIIFQNETEFQEHSRTEHDVPEAYVGTLSGAARRPGLQKITECPFGDDFAPTENIESNTVFSSEELQLHIATHLKEISLLALQKLPCDDDDSSQYMASDLLSETEGVAKLRDSMYSVLDDEAFDFVHEPDDEVMNHSEEVIASSVKALNLEDRDETGMTPLHRASTQ